MQRRPSTQDLTWLLDLHNNQQLDLNPPYQRRSVWTRRDRQFFLDTVFRNFPSPAIFLHKSIDESGKATYHVVDGKQRLQAILDFVNDRLRLATNFGDVRLDGKKWTELQGDAEMKQRLWNYQITVEMIDIPEGSVVNEVFDRLNRNARKLTSQELRHAKFDGWLITEVEAESTRDEWKTFGVVTPARAKRMVDTQFISELMLLMLERRVLGFDQEALDELYAKYEDPADSVPELNADAFLREFAAKRQYVHDLNEVNGAVARFAKGFANFYSLWSLVALSENLPSKEDAAARYAEFMQQVELLAGQDELDRFLREADPGAYTGALTYLNAARGASTDLAPRRDRLASLQASVLDPSE